MPMQLQRQHISKGGKISPSIEIKRTATPHGNERLRSRVSRSQQQPPQSPVAALRELTQRILDNSSSYGYDSKRESNDAKPTQKQSYCSNSHSPSPKCDNDVEAFRRFSESDSDRKRLELEAREFRGHFQQLPFGSRAQVNAKSSSISHRHHKKHYAGSDYATPPPLPYVFVKDTVKRSRPPNKQNTFSKSKNINLNDLQLQPPTTRQISQSNQSSESDTVVSLQGPTQFSRNQGRSAEDGATSQLRLRQIICMDIVQSAEEGKSPLPRTQLKEVIAEYHRSRNSNNPISPSDPNFAEIPSEFPQVLTNGLPRSQNILQATTEPNTNHTRRRRSRFSESYATKKNFGDQR